MRLPGLPSVVAALTLLTSCGGGGNTAAPQTSLAAPSITSFLPGKSPITKGAATTLTAVFRDGTGTVDQGIGTVASGMPVTVSPSVDTSYTLSVKSSAGSVTKTVDLQVIPAPQGAANFSPTGDLGAGRTGHTATLLPNGRVLVVGGYDTGFLGSAELYDPGAGTFSATGNLLGSRRSHTATLLSDGKVLIVGGSSTSGYLASAERYDPSTGLFTATGSLSVARNSATATLLANGTVLIAGGLNGSYLASAELYDPATGSFTPTGGLGAARYSHTATLLASGKVLIVGGFNGAFLASAELYNPATGAFNPTGSLSTARTNATASPLLNGKVLVAGGGLAYITAAEQYDPATGAFTAAGSLITARNSAAATLLPSGRVLLTGGQNTSFLASAELYDPATGAFTAAGSLLTARYSHTATLLPDGKVLIAGGTNSSYLATAELYDPQDVLTPAIQFTPSDLQLTLGSPAAPITPASTGGAVTSWSITPALSAGLSLDASTGILAGTPGVLQPRQVYTVTASNASGSAEALLILTVVAPPTLTAFAAAPNPVASGGSSTLTGIFAGGTGSLDHGLGSVTSGVGSSTGPLTASQTYTLTVTNAAGSSATATLTVTVGSGVAITSFTATPSTISVGQSATLAPVFVNATSAGIDQGIGVVTSGTGYSATPATTTSYTLSAQGLGGPALELVTVTVVPLPTTPVVTAPATVTAGATGLLASVPGQAGCTYLWTVSGGTITAGGASANLTFTAGAVGNLVLTCVVTNAAGTASAPATATVTVNPAPPSSLTYATNPAAYTINLPITANVPSNVGGAVVTYAVSPALPAGLGLDTTTGVISGTPTALAAIANYLVTATNTAGSTTTSLALRVDDAAPSGLAYSTNPATYLKNVAIAANTPSSSGGAVLAYTVSPVLPGGLSLHPATGILSGTPTVLFAPATYTVTAANSGGSTTAALSITVNELAPNTLTYSANPATYPIDLAIAPNVPATGGGTPVSYSVAPPLPLGLTLNLVSGVIAGTPTMLTGPANYLVVATNSAGSTSALLTITVTNPPPNNLIYGANPATYAKDVAIPNNLPSSGGGAVVSYAILPALPVGLNLNTTTGAISGTPTAVTATASYTVTASNAAGSTTALLTLTIIETPPTGLTYSFNPAVYTKNLAIPNNTPSSGGSAVLAYAVAPALPAGLSLNPATGIVSGTPTGVTGGTNFTVTATNLSGSSTVSLNITVNDVPPSGLSYSANPATYTRNVAIANNTPSSGGGAVLAYTVAPALPAGLSLNAVTGVLSGTPTAVTATATYTLTATNSGGSTSAALSLTINDVAPNTLTYSTNPVTYTKNVPITPNPPTSAGGTVLAYTIAPALPAGLSLNSGTGVISGTPTVATTAVTYTVTATNTGGSTTAALIVTVLDVPPSGLTYSTNPATYTLNLAILANTPSGGGGAVVSYTVAPALPAGLSLDAATGVISGTPTALAATANYLITATNNGGSTAVSLSLAVVDALTFLLTDVTNPSATLPLTLNQIPGGTFTMGQAGIAEPLHAVTLSSFYMARFETTQAQWQALLGTLPAHFTGDLARPVESVSWDDISQSNGFLAKLNAATVATRPAGLVFRLPTEAEWEYACRGGAATLYYWGDDATPIGTYAWYWFNNGATSHPVGQKIPNAFGLSDMTGNVWEWCQDWFGTYGSTAQTDPVGPASGAYRVQRGGSWYSYANDCRSAVRFPSTSTNHYPYVGFRVVLGAPRIP